jgi:hypothetical protein
VAASIRVENDTPSHARWAPDAPDPSRNMVLGDLLDALDGCDTGDVLAVTAYAPPSLPPVSCSPTHSHPRSPEPPPMKRSLFSRLVLPLVAAALATSLGLSGCVGGKLTPAAAVDLSEIDGPLCTAVGGGVTILAGPAGAIVALLCKAVADDVIAGETASDGGVGAALPIAVSAGCVPVPVPGDALHQVACLELHDRVRAATARRVLAAAGRVPR